MRTINNTRWPEKWEKHFPFYSGEAIIKCKLCGLWYCYEIINLKVHMLLCGLWLTLHTSCTKLWSHSIRPFLMKVSGGRLYRKMKFSMVWYKLCCSPIFLNTTFFFPCDFLHLPCLCMIVSLKALSKQYYLLFLYTLPCNLKTPFYWWLTQAYAQAYWPSAANLYFSLFLAPSISISIRNCILSIYNIVFLFSPNSFLLIFHTFINDTTLPKQK